MKHSGKTPALLMLFLLPVSVFAQQKINQTSFIAHPESVVSDGSYYYVADIGKSQNPTEKDGDGIIWKMDLSGKASKDSVFATGLHAPKGVAISNHLLFAADIDRILGFDLSSGEKKYDIDLSATKTVLLNDIAVKDDKTLFVSATDINKIFVVYLSGQPSFEELTLANPIHGPNGLAFNAKQNRLYACSFNFDSPKGEVGYIDLNASKRKFTKITDRLGYYDGIALPDDKTVIVSDWVAFEKKGVLVKINTAGKSVEIINSVPIAGPADFMLSGKGDIITPAMMEGDVLEFKAKK